MQPVDELNRFNKISGIKMFTSKSAENQDIEPILKRVQRQQVLAHDVRSALNGVMGGLSLIDAGCFSDANSAHFNRATSSAKMLLNLLEGADGILAGGASSSTQEKAIDLATEIAAIKSRWAGEALAKGLGFAFNAEDVSAKIEIAALDFQRIINNVIGNATKYTERGSIKVEFELTQDELVCAVQDSGPGFSDYAIENLFAFRARAESPNENDSGLGLYIVKTLVEQAGGSIEVTNNSDVGAVVTVRFPLANKGTAPLHSVGGETKNDLPDLSRLKILLAEDNLTNQLVAKQMIKSMNGDCTLAADGVEAINAFGENEFDIALIDIEMPRMSGLEVMHEIRQRGDDRASTPLVALTAYVLPEHRERIMAAGADGLISKPLTSIANFGMDILAFAKKGPLTPKEKLVSPVREKKEGIDMSIYNGLAEMIGADSMQELLGKVSKDIEDVKAAIATGFDQKDAAKIGSNTHILISVAGAIGAVPLQNLAQKLNSQSKTPDWIEIAQNVAHCVSGCEDVLKFVNSRLGEQINPA